LNHLRLPVSAIVGLLCTGFLVSLGTFWAYQRGANDFSVFYEAWRLVMAGKGSEIYRNSPDRYLYAPGFAWLLSPLGLLPKSVALAIWCFLKAAALGLMIGALGRRIGWVASAWTALLISRPLLIDLQYGQVNLFILVASVWALLVHSDSRQTAGPWDGWAWFALSLAAVAKLFPAPLLIVPWILTEGVPRARLIRERAGMLLGLSAILLAPSVSLGLQGAIELIPHWKEALVARGFPTESHNQSFAAFLQHYFSGEPVHVLAEHGARVFSSVSVLLPETRMLLAHAWSFSMMGLALGWMLFGMGAAGDALRWLAILVGFLILPSHLVWKPYFVLTFPLALIFLQDALRDLREKSSLWRLFALAFLAGAMNLTTIDFIGNKWAGQFEAASVLLFVHLALMILAYLGKSEITVLKSKRSAC
jgi:hypothetical protein